MLINDGVAHRRIPFGLAELPPTQRSYIDTSQFRINRDFYTQRGKAATAFIAPSDMRLVPANIDWPTEIDPVHIPPAVQDTLTQEQRLRPSPALQYIK